MHRSTVLAALFLPTVLGAQAAAPANGEQLLAAMHDRYAATWYPTLTFVQKSTWYKPDGSEDRVQTWHEALEAPGLLRIAMGDAARRTGAIFRNDSTYSFQQGKLARATAQRNLLLVLGFDVYKQPAARTAAVLRDEGVDLARFHRETFQGRPVYVVGADAGDSTSNQFWVDADRLLFVRLIQSNPAGTSRQDIRFNRYVTQPGGWLAEQVQVYAGGKLVYEEDYSDVHVNMTFDPALFSPESWATVRLWWH
jgi:outer membrane lipoprotein-sorting protein